MKTAFSGPVISQAGFYGGDTPGNSWFVDTDYGSNRNGKDWAGAFATMAQAVAMLKSGDKIYFRGNVREQVTPAINLFDISIIGCGNRPRNSDAVTGYMSKTGATWRTPASATAATPLLKVRNQGWKFVNILFNGPTDAASILLQRDAVADPNEQDASHAAFYNCRFVGGQNGIEDRGGCYNVLIDGCEFLNITDGTGRAIWCSSTAVANPLSWKIYDSIFDANDNHIVAAASGWFIGRPGSGNVFGANSVTAKILLTGGVATNKITGNFLGGTYSNVGGYTGAGAGDEWFGNWGSTSPTVSDPA